MQENNLSLTSDFSESFPSSPLSTPSFSNTPNFIRQKNCQHVGIFENRQSNPTPKSASLKINQDSSKEFSFRRNSNSLDYKRSIMREKLNWKKSFCELSEKLEEICGSNSNNSLSSTHSSQNSLNSHSLSSSPLTSSRLSKTSISFQKESDPFDDSPPSDLTRLSQSPHSPIKRAESLFESGNFKKTLVVRHIETNHKLQDQLLQITLDSRIQKKFHKNSSKNIFPPQIFNQSIPSYHSAGKNIMTINLEKQVKPGNFSVRLEGTKIVLKDLFQDEERELKANLTSSWSQNLLCLLSDDNLKLSFYFFNTKIVELKSNENENYIPVVKGDDQCNGEYKIYIRLGNEHLTDQMQVRTVDNALIINFLHKWRAEQNKNISNFHPSSFPPPAPSPHYFLSCDYRVLMLLPSTVDCRSVSAFISNSNQLVIKSHGIFI